MNLTRTQKNCRISNRLIVRQFFILSWRQISEQLSQQQNRRNDTIKRQSITTIPQTSPGSSIIRNMPAAIQNNANPQTFFINTSPRDFCCFIVFTGSVFYSSSSESRISMTSFSVIVPSFFSVKRSTTSGIISKIFVIVS